MSNERKSFRYESGAHNEYSSVSVWSLNTADDYPFSEMHGDAEEQI